MSDTKTLCFGLAVVVVYGALSISGLAQQAPAPPPITMKMLKPDVWAGMGGAGGNSTIIIGKTGVIVVDAKQTEAGAKDLLAEVAKITPKPVTTAIITHSDGDHVNGLAAFPAGIKIIAHANNKKEQEAALAAGGRGAPPADRLPNQVVAKNKETMTIDGVKLWSSRNPVLYEGTKRRFVVLRAFEISHWCKRARTKAQGPKRTKDR